MDPKNKAVTVYTFDDHDISEHLTYKIPDQAWAITFPDLAVDLGGLFQAPIVKMQEEVQIYNRI